MQTNKQYNENLIERVYRSYYSNREQCKQQYEMAESEDLGKIYNTLRDERAMQQIFSKISVVILTANKYEKNVLHANVVDREKQKIQRMLIELFPQRNKNQKTYAYYFNFQGYDILHIESQVTGSYTIGGSADLVRYVLDNHYLYPTIIISLGICFGIHDEKQFLGDTIISQKVYPYFMGAKYNEEGYFVSDDNMFRIRQELYSKMKSEIIDLNVLNGLGFHAYLGNYMTGEAVISKRNIRDLFAKKVTNQTVDAGDMEGYGLFKECYGAVMPCLIVKSICDWGVQKNINAPDIFKDICGEECLTELTSVKDRLQAYASYNAFCVLAKLLEKRIFESSIYIRLKDKIRSDKHEHVIYYARIKKDYLKNIFLDSLVSEEFVLMCCQNMVEEGVLSEISQGKSWEIL